MADPAQDGVNPYEAAHALDQAEAAYQKTPDNPYAVAHLADVKGIKLDATAPVGSPGFIGGIADYARGLVHGTIAGAPKQLGDAATFFNAPETGQRLQDFAKEQEAAHPGAQVSQIGQLEADNPYSLRGAAGQAGENTPLSVGPALAGAGIGAGIGTLIAPGPGTLAGAGLGYIAGSLASLPAFYGSQGQQTKEKVYKAQIDAGVPEAEAEAASNRAGHLSGTAEAGGELLEDVIPFHAIAKPFMKPVAGALVRSTLAGAGKKALGTLAKTELGEIGTEMAQQATESQIEGAYGAGPGATWKDTASVILPTAIMSLIPGGFAGLHSMRTVAQVRNALDDPEEDANKRASAAVTVYNQIKDHDPKVAKAFDAYAAKQIEDGEKVDVNQNDAFYLAATRDPNAPPASAPLLQKPPVPGEAPDTSARDQAEAQFDQGVIAQSLGHQPQTEPVPAWLAAQRAQAEQPQAEAPQQPATQQALPAPGQLAPPDVFGIDREAGIHPVIAAYAGDNAGTHAAGIYAARAAEEARQAALPSNVMGLDPNAGPISAAAATAVNTGAATVPAPTKIMPFATQAAAEKRAAAMSQKTGEPYVAAPHPEQPGRFAALPQSQIDAQAAQEGASAAQDQQATKITADAQKAADTVRKAEETAAVTAGETAAAPKPAAKPGATPEPEPTKAEQAAHVSALDRRIADRQQQMAVLKASTDPQDQQRVEALTRDIDTLQGLQKALGGKPETSNAVQKPGAGTVLQREPQQAGSGGGERGRVQSGEQGGQAAGESAPAGERANAAQPAGAQDGEAARSAAQRDTERPVKLGAGDQVYSESGRALAPFPKVDTSSDAKARNSIGRVDQWLLDEARKEVAGKPHQTGLLAGLDAKRLSPSDRDTLNDVLFGDERGARAKHRVAPNAASAKSPPAKPGSAYAAPLRGFATEAAARQQAEVQNVATGVQHDVIPHPNLKGQFAVDRRVDTGGYTGPDRREAATTTAAPTTTEKVQPAPAAEKDTQRFAKAGADAARKRFLKAIRDNGGIDMAEVRDISGDTAFNANKLSPGLFRKNGKTIDLVAERLHELGYISDEEYQSTDGGVQRVRDIVRTALDGKPVYRMSELDAAAERSLAESVAEEHNVPVDAVAEAIDSLAPDTTVEEAIAGFDAAAYLAQHGIEGDAAEAIIERAAIAAENGTDYESAVKAEAEGHRSSREGAAENTGEAARAAVGQDFALQAESNAEVTAKEAAAKEQAAAEAKAAADAEANARAARVAQEIKGRSTAAAGTFELGQSAEQNLSGQGDLLSAPAPALAKTDDQKRDEFRALVAKQKAQRAALESQLAERFAQDGVVTALRDDGKQRIALTADAHGQGAYRVTSFEVTPQGDEPTGHRVYNTIEDAASEFTHGVKIEAKAAEKPALELAAPAKGSLEDTGENLWANRRNFRVGIGWADVKDLNDALKVREVQKAKVWKKPNYEQLVSDGMNPIVARVVKQVYDSIASAPHATDDVTLKGYIEAVQRVRDDVFAWAQDTAAVKAYAEAAAASLKNRMANRFSFGGKEGISLSTIFLKRLFPSIYDQPTPGRFGRGTPERAELLLLGGNRFLQNIQLDSDAVVKMGKDIQEGWPAPQEAWQKSYELREDEVRGEDVPGGTAGTPQKRWNVYEKGSRYRLASRDTPKEGFATRDEAMAHARELTKRTRDNKGADIRGTNVANAERIGAARREEGHNVSAHELATTFGFRGVNFGRQSYINDAERQAYVNAAYDGLLDLADVLGVPPKALSLDGKLGIAFGAQGRGGNAAAHFVPGVNEINLTKTMGSGTLAHEFGHALDHYFAVIGGLGKDRDPFLSAHATEGVSKRVFSEGRTVEVNRFNPALRPEILAAFKTLREAMVKRPMTPEEVATQTADRAVHARSSVERWLKAIRGNVSPSKPADVARFNELEQRILTGDTGPVVRSGQIALHQATAELRALSKQVRGRYEIASNMTGLDNAVAYMRHAMAEKVADATHEPQRTHTAFARESAAKDREKKGAAYWATPHEMFARAFETFVANRLGDNAAKNTFLSDALERAAVKDRDDATRFAHPYPRAEESNVIGKAFDTLVGALKTKEEGDRTVLYNAGDEIAPEVPQTPAFKRWFGDSKVVDAAGQPRVVYHGARDDIADNVFEGREITGWFAENPASTEPYSQQHEDEDQPNSLPVYLALKNPLDLTRKFDMNEALNAAVVYRKAGLTMPADQKRFIQNGAVSAYETVNQHSFQTAAEAAGYDGIKVNEDGHATWAAFRPEQIKSAIGNDGTFDTNDRSILSAAGEQIAPEHAPIFYSALARAIDEKAPFAKNGTAQPGALRMWLAARAKDGTFKPDELAWSGLDDWLKAWQERYANTPDMKLMRADVAAFLDQNGVKVTEKLLGESGVDQQKPERQAWISFHGHGHEAHDQQMHSSASVEDPESQYRQAVDEGRAVWRDQNGHMLSDTEAREIAAEWELYWERQSERDNAPNGWGEIEAGEETQYAKYTLPGGENYRELLLTLPRMPGELRAENEAVAANERGDAAANLAANRRMADAQRASFRSSHFTEPNILAHVRFDDRTDADGKRVLFIEEFQSDWAQKGRRDGFKGVWDPEWEIVPVTYAAMPGVTEYSVVNANGQRIAGSYATPEKAREMALQSGVGNRVPSAPFVQKTEAWLALALKRMIRYAAEHGYDRVAWTNGEQQAERYDLSKHVETLLYRDSTHELTAFKVGGGIGIERRVAPKDLPDAIGKEAAERLLNAPVGLDGYRKLAGLQLRIGGEGMRAFYDQIVPNVANDVLKKLGGGKVAAVTMRRETPRALTTYTPVQASGAWRIEGEQNGRRFAANIDGRYATREEAQAHIDNMPGAEKTAQQPGFDITPALRGAALRGQPLFAAPEQQQQNTIHPDQYVPHTTAFSREAPIDIGGEPHLELRYGENVRSLTGHELNAVTEAVRTTLAMGVPKVVVDNIGPVGVHPEVRPSNGHAMGSASYWPDYNAITLHADTVAMLDDPLKRRYVPGLLTHELGHMIDNTPGSGFASTQSPYFEIKTLTAGNTSKRIASGTVMAEALRAFKRSDDSLLHVALRYPMAWWQEDIGNIEHDGFLQSELFAQLYKLYHTNPSVLRREMPLAARVIAEIDHGIEENRDVSSGGLDGARRAVQEALRIGDPASRAGVGGRVFGGIARNPALGPDVRHARGGVEGPIPDRRVAEVATNYFSDLLRAGPRVLNPVLKNLQTQYHKAESTPEGREYFRPVFRATQAYIRDVSRFALDAANLAPRVLPQLARIRDLFPKFLGGTETAKRADLKQVAKAVFVATLGDVRPTPQQLATGMTVQVVYEEGGIGAADIPALTPKQIDLYNEVRAALDQSIDATHVSELVKMAQGEGIDAVLANAKENSTTGAYAILEAMWGKAEALDAQGQLTEAIRVRGLRQKMVELNDIATGLKAKGYAPLQRFGTYTLEVTSFDAGRPKQEYFGTFESKTALHAMERDLRELFPDASFTPGTMNPEAWKLMQGMSLDSLYAFAQATGQTEGHLVQDFFKLAVSSRSALKRLIHRKGIRGFDEDLPRVLASFLTSNARLASKNYHFGEIGARVDALNKTPYGDLAAEATKLMLYVQNPIEEASKVRGLLFTNFIGGSIASALTNATQPYLMTYPYLSQYTDPLAAGKAVMLATRDALLNHTPSDAALADALTRAAQEGVTDPQELHQLYAQSIRSVGSSEPARKFLRVWGSAFALAESFNRRVTFIAAFRIGQTMSEEQFARAGVTDAYSFATKAVDDTQGIYNRGNRPNVARGALGATVFTFKQFSVAYLEFFSRLPLREKMLAGSLLILAAGVQGAPGADDLGDIIDTIGQMLGFNTNSKQALRQAAIKYLHSETAGTILTQGISGVPGVPIDVQARLGLGNLIPGTSLFKRSEVDKSRDMLEAIGPLGGVVQQAMRGFDAGVAGYGYGVAQSVLPMAVQNALKGVDMWTSGVYHDYKGRKVIDVTHGDAVSKFIGFQPSDVAQDSQLTGEAQQNIAMARVAETAIADKWARGILEHDAEGVRSAVADLHAWNLRNPATPIVITPAQIRQRVQQALLPRDLRVLKSAPKEVRGNTVRDLNLLKE